ncbi:hypothetical protein BGZ49_004550 [Haplosporangium sp. Z 27]|nr:hypothetical protein BGZ49_004550 [Haplosporangium sp. Z 27]
MVSESTRKTLILSVSAIVGITTVSTLAYLLIQDDRRAKHLRKIRTLQKSLNHKLSKAESSIQELIDNDIRLAQVRTRTLRTHPIYPGDPNVKLPSLGLINKQDEIDLGDEIEETQDELIRERTQGYGEDSQKVRQGYKRLDFLIASVNERLLRLLESLDAISPRELTDLGDGFGGIASANGPEIQAFEKVRKRKRSIIEKAQNLMAKMDKIAATFKERLVAVEIYEKKEAEAAAAAAEEEENAKQANGDSQHLNGQSAENAEVKEALSFAEVTKQNIPEPEILEKTADLEKMNEGVTFAEVASINTQHEDSTSSSTTTTTTTSTTTLTSSIANGSAIIVESEQSGKEVDNVSFADIVSKQSEKSEYEEEVKTDVLEPTEDLEKMKEGVTFADVAAITPPAEEDKNEEEKPAAVVEGVSFAEVAAAH